MKMNLEKLWFERGEFCLHMYMRSDAHSENDDYDKDILYIAPSELEPMLKDLRGESEYCPFYNDGGYLLKLWNKGARYLRTSSYIGGGGGKYTEHWYSFDGDWFARQLEIAMQLKEGEDYEVPSAYIEIEKARLAPKVEWIFGEGVEAALDEDRAVENIYVDDYGNVHNTQGCIDAIQRMAENRSDGQTVTVKFWFDLGFNAQNNLPHTYYYEVYDYSKGTDRLWNGGVVPHIRKGNLWDISTHS